MSTPEVGTAIAGAEALASLIERYRMVDLSHALEAGIPAFPTHPRYRLDEWDTGPHDPAEVRQLTLGDHTGTHVDCPAHFVPDEDDPRRRYTTDTPLDGLVGRAVKVSLGPVEPVSAAFSAADLRRWEAGNVPLAAGDIVLLDFGWAVHWKLGTAGSQYLRGWPGLTHDAAEYLLGAGVKAVGTDCASIDPGDASGADLRAHYTLLPNGVLVLENLTNLAAVPAVSFFLAFPLPIVRGLGSPVRAVCLVPRSWTA